MASKECYPTNGVPQGSTLSPHLFNIAIKSLADILNKLGVEFRLYADDTVIVGSAKEIDKALKELENWCVLNNMEVNRAKSGIMLVEGEMDENILNGYPAVSTYKYLGMNLSKKLDTKSHLGCITEKIAQITYCLSPIRNKKNLKVNRNLFTVFIEPLYRMCFTVY